MTLCYLYRSLRCVAALLWEPRDLWVGVYLDPQAQGMRVYVCLLPCLPVRISWWQKGEEA
jgi:hypothetical protein